MHPPRSFRRRPSWAHLPARAGFLLTLLVWTAGFTSIEAALAPAAKLWPRWTRSDAASTVTVDHQPWQRLLSAYVRTDADGINRFAYGEVNAADRQALTDYIDQLAATPVSSLSRNEQFAYWVNLYNALTVQLILDHYPVASIRDIDISPGVFADGPWDRKLVGIEGEAVSLNDIEHRILRPIWRDARVHYAVNCASLGCPNLQTEPFTADNSDRLLDLGASTFVNSRRAAMVLEGALTASSIYVWFAEDFGGSDRAIIDHLRLYAAPPLDAQLAGIDRIAHHRYDWRLNDATAAAVR